VSEHPDVEALAAYSDGESALAEPTLAAHIQDCQQCQDTVTALARTRADLDRVAESLLPAMPADVAGRLHARLTAEIAGPGDDVQAEGAGAAASDGAAAAATAAATAAARTTPATSPGAPPDNRPPGRPGNASSRRTDRRRWHVLVGAPGATAAVVVVVLAAAAGIALSVSAHHTSPASASAAGTAPSDARIAPTKGAPAGSGAGLAHDATTPTTVPAPSSAVVATRYLTTGANYTRRTLRVGVITLLDRYDAASSSPTGAHLNATALRCVAAYHVDARARPYLVDRARWKGALALVMIFPSGRSWAAYVVTLSTCELQTYQTVVP
jgi:hypothetical protein